MKIKLKYKINILSDWHIGSGLDAGTNIDLLVLKTNKNLPFIPGKTIKGLLRDAAMDLSDVQQINSNLIVEIFGSRTKHNESTPGSAAFSNASLEADQQLEIVDNKLSPFLYRAIASTAITETGIALEKSLRSMEVCLPVELHGQIEVEKETHFLALQKAAKLVRHFGVQRNRGLGRCRFSITKKMEA